MIRKSNFTLTEIVVALGIFSIIMLVLMQFFTTSQRAWTDSEKRTRAYSDARVLFELIDSSLKSAELDDHFSAGANNSLSFRGLSPVRHPDWTTKDRIGDIVFEKNADDEITVKVTPTSGSGITAPILANVRDFTVQFYTANWGNHTGATRPPRIQIMLSLFGSKADYDIYQTLSAAAKDAFFQENGYTFGRLYSFTN